jgi:hypothetical protein
MNVHAICDSIKPLVDKYKDEEYIEMELRLGKYNGTFFDTNVGKDTFDKYLAGLYKYTGWESINAATTEVYHRAEDKTRLTIDDKSGEETFIKKERVRVEDFKQVENAPFDIRFGISRETPIEDNGNSTFDSKKVRHRTSFIRKNLSIDMTVSTGTVDDMDAEESTVFQVEFEIIDPRKVNDNDTLFNITHKVKDFFNMLDSYIC